MNNNTVRRRIETFFAEMTLSIKEIITMPPPIQGRMFILLFAIELPVLVLTPTLSRHFSNLRDPYMIQRREVWLLSVLMIFFGGFVRKIEDESFPAILTTAFLPSVYASIVIALFPPWAS